MESTAKLFDIPEPPNPRPETRIERIRRSFRSLRPPIRVLVGFLLPLLTVSVVAFIFTVRATKATTACMILLGNPDEAFDAGAGPWGVLLGVAGYLLLPALVAQIVTIANDR